MKDKLSKQNGDGSNKKLSSRRDMDLRFQMEPKKYINIPQIFPSVTPQVVDLPLGMRHGTHLQVMTSRPLPMTDPYVNGRMMLT